MGRVCVQAGRRQRGQPVPCPMLSFIQECAVWTPRQAKRLATTWSRSSTLLCSQACKGDLTTTPLLVTHPTPWLPCCYPPQPDPHLAHDPTQPQARSSSLVVHKP